MMLSGGGFKTREVVKAQRTHLLTVQPIQSLNDLRDRPTQVMDKYANFWRYFFIEKKLKFFMILSK